MLDASKSILIIEGMPPEAAAEQTPEVYALERLRTSPFHLLSENQTTIQKIEKRMQEAEREMFRELDKLCQS